MILAESANFSCDIRYYYIVINSFKSRVILISGSDTGVDKSYYILD